VISMAVPASVAILPLFLPCLRPLATAGVGVLANLMVGVLVVFAFVQGRREQVG